MANGKASPRTQKTLNQPAQLLNGRSNFGDVLLDILLLFLPFSTQRVIDAATFGRRRRPGAPSTAAAGAGVST